MCRETSLPAVMAAGLPARSHNVECRTLVEQRLMETEEGRDRVMRARKRKADAVVPAIEDAQRRLQLLRPSVME